MKCPNKLPGQQNAAPKGGGKEDALEGGKAFGKAYGKGDAGRGGTYGKGGNAGKGKATHSIEQVTDWWSGAWLRESDQNFASPGSLEKMKQLNMVSRGSAEHEVVDMEGWQVRVSKAKTFNQRGS